MGKKLHRSSVNRMLFGVCGGIGEYFNIDPTIIRLAWALFAFTGGIVFYIIAALIIPSDL
jgi:phage shock protein PspC (stress-responsive transcriptional regulator)